MGTTLTGTTPQDTYDSLIKVTDNGPLSGSLKTLTDGLGNDSALALSTGAASITGTLTTSSITRAERLQVGTASTLNTPAGTGNTLQFANYIPSAFVTGSADSYIYKNSSVFGGLAAQSLVFQTRSDVTGGGFAFVAGGTPAVVARITGTGNVGIGTSSPESKLHVAGSAAGSDVTLYIDNAAASTLNNSSRLKFSSDLGSNVSGGGAELNCLNVNAGNGAVDFLIKSWSGSSYTEKARFLAGGGLTFNGDTAAANALDDYEEGTWTMGVSFGGGTTGITYYDNTGTYTKIGRQVTVNGYLTLTSKGSSTGDAQITGLPFTIGNSASYYGVPSLWLDDITFANVYSGYGVVGDTKLDLYEFTEAGAISSLTNADFADTSRIMISLTYFV